MSTHATTKPVLILGGSGQAGAGTARTLRRWHPDLPFTIAARDLGRARKVADELGNATAVTIDIGRPDLGLPDGDGHSAVLATLWDDRLHGLGYAQRHRIPYAGLSSSILDLAPELVTAAQGPDTAPILSASHWCAGVTTLAALDAARGLDRVDGIRVGAILDESDTGGPAGQADLERWAAVSSAGLVRRDGVFTWVTGPDAQAVVRGMDGNTVPAQTIPILDVPSLALATGAPDVRFDFAVGESAGRGRGEGPSVEFRIDLQGTDKQGNPVHLTRHVEHPDGQRPLTALGLALGVERLLGRKGAPVKPGIHTPEALVDPAYAMSRLRETGATIIDK